MTAPPCQKRQAFSALFARHRFAQVDFQIGLTGWVNARGDMDLVIAQQDFIRHPHAQTEIKLTGHRQPIIPDGVFGVTAQDGASAMFLVEIHRATSARAVTDQLARYFDVIQTGAIRQKYGLDVNPIICSIHFQPSVLASVKQRLLADHAFTAFRHNFIFRAGDDLRGGFTTDWHFADDTPAYPFPEKA